MKNFIIILFLLMVSIGSIYSQTKKITSTQTIGNFTYTYFDDGTCVTSQKIGNTTYHNSNDGTTGNSQQIGNFQYHNFSNGISGTTQKIGNTYYTNFNDGTNNTTQINDNANYNLKRNSNSYNAVGNNSNEDDMYKISNSNQQYSGYNNQTTQQNSCYLNIINSTNNNVYFCYVSYDINNGWQAIGWFQINANSNISVNLGNYVGNNIYLYAEYPSGELFWGDSNSKYSFCIDPYNQFTIPNSDSKKCEGSNFKRVKMFEMKVAAGINYWSLKN